MRLLVAVNPTASRVDTTLDELATWFGRNSEAHFVTTSSQDDLRQTLLRYGQAVERIVIGGGDGTISNALPELLQLDKPLIVVPLGTANDFARTLGLPQDSLEAARIALNGRAHKIDVGLVNGRPFLNVASVGVAAKVSQAQSKGLKRTWRILSYLIGLLREARQARPFNVELAIDGVPSWAGAVYQVSVGNGRSHGGGLTVAEDAAIDDGRLDLYLVIPGRLWQLVASLTHLKFGLAKPEVLKRLSGVTVNLLTDRPRLINVDGELAMETPAMFGLLPKALTVMIPRTLPANHPGLSPSLT